MMYVQFNDLERLILDHIKGRRKENPISLSDLAHICHVDKKEIKRAVHRLRTEYPICSSMSKINGYYIGDMFELDANVGRFFKTAATLEDTGNRLLEAFKMHKPMVKIKIPEEYFTDTDKLKILLGNDTYKVKAANGTLAQVRSLRISKYTKLGIIDCVRVTLIDTSTVCVPIDFVEWVGYSDEL